MGFKRPRVRISALGPWKPWISEEIHGFSVFFADFISPLSGVLGFILSDHLRDLENRVPDGHGVDFVDSTVEGFPASAAAHLVLFIRRDVRHQTDPGIEGHHIGVPAEQPHRIATSGCALLAMTWLIYKLKGL